MCTAHGHAAAPVLLVGKVNVPLHGLLPRLARCGILPCEDVLCVEGILALCRGVQTPCRPNRRAAQAEPAASRLLGLPERRTLQRYEAERLLERAVERLKVLEQPCSTTHQRRFQPLLMWPSLYSQPALCSGTRSEGAGGGESDAGAGAPQSALKGTMAEWEAGCEVPTVIALPLDCGSAVAELSAAAVDVLRARPAKRPAKPQVDPPLPPLLRPPLLLPLPPPLPPPLPLPLPPPPRHPEPFWPPCAFVLARTMLPELVMGCAFSRPVRASSMLTAPWLADAAVSAPLAMAARPALRAPQVQQSTASAPTHGCSVLEVTPSHGSASLAKGGRSIHSCDAARASGRSHTGTESAKKANEAHKGSNPRLGLRSGTTL